MNRLLDSLTFIFNHPLTRHHRLHTVAKVLWWKCNQWFFSTPVVVELEKNISIICSPDDSYASSIVCVRWPEYESMAYLKKKLSTKSVFIDIGAGIGEHSLLAASVIKTGAVYACEPNPAVIGKLTANIHFNKLDKIIKVVPKVVSDKTGTLIFSVDKTSELSSIGTKAQTGRKLASITLDSLIQQHNIPEVNVVKIDTEGAELLVLRGAKNALQRHTLKHLIIELNPKCQRYGYSVKDTLEYLVAMKYRLYTEDEQLINSIPHFLAHHPLTTTIFCKK